MDTEEAKAILRERLQPYRNKTYVELRRLIGAEPDTYLAAGPGGEKYQVEIEVIWDDKPNGDIRVCGTIDEFPHKPLFWKIPVLRWIPIYVSSVGEDFILSREGKFAPQCYNGTAGCCK